MSFQKTKLSFIILTFLSLINFVFAQQKESRQSGSVEGSVLDQSSSSPLEFANIVLFSLPDSIQVTGIVTDNNGNFKLAGLKNGNYFLRISFIGYENSLVNQIQIRNSSPISLGKIYLSPKTIGLKDIEVSRNRAPISYEIDKKVINVGENFSASSGTAIDVLENIPSITVDIEGNVSLRGSGNFKVLIDGRPSMLDPGDALQQIPASAIENIEIITNPSAKYDPEGTAGIVNIIMKKSKNQGLSGIFELNGGLKDKYGGEIITDMKNESFQSTVGLNYNKRSFGGTQTEKNWTDDGSKISYYNSSGNSNRRMEHYGLRASLAFDLGNKKILSLGGRYNSRSNSDNSNRDYSEWSSLSNFHDNFLSNTNQNRSGQSFTIFSHYTHPFKTKGHQLSAEIFFSSDKSDGKNINKLFNAFEIVNGQSNTEKETGNELESKLDYTLPLGTDTKFETGYEGQLEFENGITGFSLYNPATKQYEVNPLFDKDISYYTNEIAVYSMFSSKYKSLGYQFGFRTEYTGRDIELTGKNQKFSIDKWDYFPSVHLSYELTAGHQMMSSYTRRINRPRGWELEPFETWMDAYNIRVGNPSLLPEYIDSYEFGYQTFFGKSVLSMEAYYRVTNNRVERIQSVYSEKVTLQSVQNIGKDYSLGTELFFNFDPVNLWNVNLMGNIYNYSIEGILNEKDFSRKSFNWNIRFNNTIKLSSSTQIQINASYNSPSVSAQGRREGFLFTNFAVKQEFLDKLLTATLQVRDVFGTSKFESVNESFDFYNYRHVERESPIVMLNLRLNINNYKSRDNNRSEMPQDMGEGVEN